MNPVERAKLVAERVHQNQTYDIYPYMYHIQSVVNIAIELGFDRDIIIGCYLHDSMEDGDLSYNDIKKAFGKEVAEIVYAVTDELGRNRKERKEKTLPKIRASLKATAVKICDRIANAEQSKEYNRKLFEMYRQEHVAFKEALYRNDVETNKAWDRLDGVLFEKAILNEPYE
jgi:(p)ppGpp synthase/HD superfamily hydrolase